MSADYRDLRQQLREQRIERLIGRLADAPTRTPPQESLLLHLLARGHRKPGDRMHAGPLRADQVRIGTPAPFAWVGLEWFVALVKPGREREARDWLELAHEPVFLVEERIECRERSGARRHGNRTTIDRPLWPGYLFVARPALGFLAMTIDNDERAGLAPLFDGLLGGAAGDLWRVNGGDMQNLFGANGDLLFTPELRKQMLRQRFAPGQEVRILDGAFQSLNGILNRFVNGQSAEILVDVLGRQTRTTVRLDNLQ